MGTGTIGREIGLLHWPPMASPHASSRRDRLIAGLPDAGDRAQCIRAPGRVNLIGEHTDYTEGWVLPAAIGLELWLAFVPWDDPRVELTSLDLGETSAFSFDELIPRGRVPGSWMDHVAGVAWAAREAGLPIRGFRGVLDSTIPIGAGLGSSAALEVAAAMALLEPGAVAPVPTLAELGRRAENDFLGVGSGIMDEFATVAGRAGHAILLDCRSLEHWQYPIHPELAIVVCDTGTRRHLGGTAFDERRADCVEGARLIGEVEPGIRSLRDVTDEMLERHRDRLPERVYRRCRHVVGENLRVQAVAGAMVLGDWDAVADLCHDSHASLRDNFEVVTPELDLAVQVATDSAGVVGARMTGAGFGGCTVNLVVRDAVDAVTARLSAELVAAGLQPALHVLDAVDGASIGSPEGG
jgi:galactokinase